MKKELNSYQRYIKKFYDVSFEKKVEFRNPFVHGFFSRATRDIRKVDKAHVVFTKSKTVFGITFLQIFNFTKKHQNGQNLQEKKRQEKEKKLV